MNITTNVTTHVLQLPDIKWDKTNTTWGAVETEIKKKPRVPPLDLSKVKREINLPPIIGKKHVPVVFPPAPSPATLQE